MNPDFYKEIGLSTVWREKKQLQQAKYVENSTVLGREAATPKREISVKNLTWLPLREQVKKCTRCDLHQSRKNTVFGIGNQKPEVFIVGEGPGRDEDLQGEPFVGESGKLLDQLLHSIRLSRKQTVYISNIVKCRPPENRTPTAKEANQCLPYLAQQIALAQPQLIVAMGKVAASYLLQEESSIAQLRQKIHEYNGIPLIVSYHPSYLLRSPSEKKKAWEDCCFIRDTLKDGVPTAT